MEIPINQLAPGDPCLVDAIVSQLKSKGIFDKLRKECLADVDTKPAFLNLRQRVDGQVKKFLETKNWKADLNKNHLRDGVRKNIQESSILDSGIDAIINQVVNPKIIPLILPYVENTVYGFFQIEKPIRETKEFEAPIAAYTEPPPPLLQHNLPLFDDVKKEEAIPFKPEKKELLFSADKMDSVSSCESEISVGGTKSPTEMSPKEKIAPQEVLPMETDVISSEEDDILVQSYPPVDSGLREAQDIKMEEENAVDSFDAARTSTDLVTSNVEKLSLKDDSISVSESRELPKSSTKVPLFDTRSLDSISSNSSGLSFSPHCPKKSSSEAEELSQGKYIDNSRSSQSTPLVDEKSQSSQESAASSETWNCLPKESTENRITIASFENFGTGNNSNSASAVVAGASPLSGTASQDSVNEGSTSTKASSVPSTEESYNKKEDNKSVGEISGSSASASTTPDRQKDSSECTKKTFYSSSKDENKSSDSKERDRHKYHKSSRDDKHRSKDRKSSKSKHDDHSSHRDKDKKYHRRDRDDDKDGEKKSSHWNPTSSYSSKTSTNKSNSSVEGRDKREKSSDNYHRHKSRSSGHKSSSRRDSRRDSRERRRSRSSDRKRSDDKRPEDSTMKNKKQTDILKPIKQVNGIVTDRTNSDNKKKTIKILKEDHTFLMHLNNPKKSLKKMNSSKTEEVKEEKEKVKAVSPVGKSLKEDSKQSTKSKSSNYKPTNGVKSKETVPEKIKTSTISRVSSSDEEIIIKSKSFARKRKQFSNNPKLSRKTTLVTTISTDDENSDSGKITLQRVTIPVLSFQKEPDKKVKRKRVKEIDTNSKNKEKKNKFHRSSPVSDRLSTLFQDSDSDESEFEGFISSPSPKKKMKTKRTFKSNHLVSQGTSSDSDSVEIDVPLIQFCQSTENYDFEGFEDFSGDQKLKIYLSKCSVVSEDEFESGDDEEGKPPSTTFLATKEDNRCSSPNQSMVLANFSAFVNTSSNNQNSDPASVDFKSSNVNYDGVMMTPQSICGNSMESETSKNNGLSDCSQQTVVCLSIAKRKASDSTCESVGFPGPISKKRRILNAVRYELEESLAKDKTVISSYSLLTPEEDRSCSKDYEVDLRRGASYSPLSPASDSSADETKPKEQKTSDEDHRSVSNSIDKT